jgi:hypothetical protein
VLLQHVAESSDLFGLGVEAGRGEQAARHAERAGIERLREHFLHMAKLAFAGRPVLHAHRHQAQHDGIHRYCRPGGHIAGEIRLGERQPRRAGRKIIGEEFSFSRQSRGDRKPQLPTTSVVTPCLILASAIGLSGSVKSEWV